MPAPKKANTFTSITLLLAICAHAVHAHTTEHSREQPLSVIGDVDWTDSSDPSTCRLNVHFPSATHTCTGWLARRKVGGKYRGSYLVTNGHCIRDGVETAKRVDVYCGGDTCKLSSSRSQARAIGYSMTRRYVQHACVIILLVVLGWWYILVKVLFSVET